MSNIADLPPERAPLAWRERLLWVMVVTMVAVYTWYFWRAFTIGSGQPWRVGTIFIEAVVLIVVLQIIGSMIASIGVRTERGDERDRLVRLKAQSNSYIVLVAGIWLAFGVAFASLGTFWIVHGLLLVLVLAQLTNAFSQLFFYRAGV
jgi:hypothetical protein